MTTAIKRQFSVQWRDWIPMGLIVLGASIFGMILLGLIVVFDQECTAYFPLGTTIGGITALIYAFLMVVIQISMCFNVEVSMGSTRKQFFISYFITNLTSVLIYIAIVILVNIIERSAYRVIYAHLEEEIDFLPYLLKGSIPAAVAVAVLSAFFGALVMKFGKVASWILWALWMFTCLGFPYITEAMEEAPDSVLGKIGHAAADIFAVVPVGAWLVLAVVVCLAAFAGTWVILRRQQVTA